MMYGAPVLGFHFQQQPAKRGRGRPSDKSKFLQKQRDLFPVDLFYAEYGALTANLRAGGPQRSEDTPARSAPPATNRGGKSLTGAAGEVCAEGVLDLVSRGSAT